MKRTRISAGSIFVPGEGFVKGRSLIVSGGVITAMHDGPPEQADGGGLSFPGQSIAPLFCDYHLHFTPAMIGRAEAVRADLLRAGCGEVWEGGDREEAGIAMKGAFRGRPVVRAAGSAIHPHGRYGKAIGRGVRGVREAIRAIDRLTERGVDYIKIVNAGIFMPGTGAISPGGFGRDELTAMIDRVREKGLFAVCHASGDRAVGDACAAGASVIVHGFGVSPDTLSHMAERGVALVPTLYALSTLAEDAPDREWRENVQRAVDRHLALVACCRERGVRILPGSDAGSVRRPFGVSYREELYLLRRAGYQDEDVLSCASRGPFREGIPADFTVLDGLNAVRVFHAGAEYSAAGNAGGGALE